MSTTLTNGLKLPDKGSVDWYADMQNNYQILDGAVGTIAEHTTALSGKAPLVHTHIKADITDFPAYGTAAGTICEGNDSRLSDARTPVAHTHLTADVTDFPDMTLYPYKLAYTTNGGNFPYINLADSDHIALGFNGITDTGIYKVRATADVPGTPNAVTLDGILIVFNSDGTANVSSNRRCQQIFYQNSTIPKIFKRIGVFNTTSQTWNWDTYKWVEYANTGRDFIPNETNSLNLGSSSYQWNKFYSKEYYYNGTEFQNKFVTIDTVQTISARKDLKNYWHLMAVNLTAGAGETYSRTGYSFIYTDKNDITMGDVTLYKQSRAARTYLRLQAGDYYTNGVPDASGTLVQSELRIGTLANSTRMIECATDAVYSTIDAATDLGTSDKKWKSLNGINPGALSFPDMSATDVDISGNIVPPSGESTINISGGVNTYIPPVDGWLCIVKAASACRYIKTTVNSRLGQTTIVSGASISGSIYHCQPVPAGKTVSILLDADSQAGYYLYPCLGNV